MVKPVCMNNTSHWVLSDLLLGQVFDWVIQGPTFIPSGGTSCGRGGRHSLLCSAEEPRWMRGPTVSTPNPDHQNPSIPSTVLLGGELPIRVWTPAVYVVGQRLGRTLPQLRKRAPTNKTKQNFGNHGFSSCRLLLFFLFIIFHMQLLL